MTLPRSRAARPAPAVSAPVVGPHEGLDDRALVSLVVEQDGQALEALYSRYGRPCLALARRILTDEQFAQDVVQEVFLTVWRDAARFDASRGAFSSWLLSMTHHKAVDVVRREENVRKRRASADLLDVREDDGPQVDEQVWSTLRRERLRESLQTLPDVQREALALAYYGGHTQREIAQLTATPLGTVKTRMLAGMRTLRGRLDGVQGDGAPLAEGARRPGVRP
ncbi:MAG: polymerase, sigma-24 subunit, subfamily [Frankiales bacterium]|nr:polymerase, sigma-24 subunit, subfamily [Frankiales bacterium]